MVMMPEGPSFRSYYPPGMQEQLVDTFEKISKERGILLVNAREWLPEQELYDGHHALPPGAARFSRRLQQEVLTPLVNCLPLRNDHRVAVFGRVR